MSPLVNVLPVLLPEKQGFIDFKRTHHLLPMSIQVSSLTPDKQALLQTLNVRESKRCETKPLVITQVLYILVDTLEASGKVLQRVKIGQMWGHSNAFDSIFSKFTDAQDEDFAPDC